MTKRIITLERGHARLREQLQMKARIFEGTEIATRLRRGFIHFAHLDVSMEFLCVLLVKHLIHERSP